MVNLNLMEYVERNILPRYQEFDKAHSMEHVTSVIRRSLVTARKCGADENMSYVVAAYHDLGLSGPRAVHHITSGRMLQSDTRLRKWFSQEQIRIMREAVEDHRASASHAPRSIYGKIVAEADRDLTHHTVFRRTVQFGLANYPEKTKQEHWERFRQHMHDKYAETGYIHLWIPGSPNEESLRELREIIADDDLLHSHFEKHFEEEIAEE